MKTIKLTFCLLLIAHCTSAQNVEQRLERAVKLMLNDSQMKHAILGFYVIDVKTGRKLFDHNAQIGLAPASTQKVLTSIAALETLGQQYKFKTIVSYDGEIEAGTLNGYVYINGYGDPTLGSWRFKNRKEHDFIDSLYVSLNKLGIKKIRGNILALNNNWEKQTISGGWIWDDIGNYYGAGLAELNWKENQYDLYLQPGNKEGDPVSIVKTEPALYKVHLKSELTTGMPGSGDNSYIYLAPYASEGVIKGTVPAGKSFKVSGSVPNPKEHFITTISKGLEAKGISSMKDSFMFISSGCCRSLFTYYSPTLDSIVYWFLQKSVNVYGEALLKVMAFEKNGKATTTEGVKLIQQFYEQQGIDKASVDIMDGSGLSPQNRITAIALVKALQFAKTRPWFNSFYAGLPLYNNIKMKSGTIGGVKAFTGYQTSKAGQEYAFAIIVNNYDGAVSSIVQKMYKVLDELKK